MRDKKIKGQFKQNQGDRSEQSQEQKQDDRAEQRQEQKQDEDLKKILSAKIRNQLEAKKYKINTLVERTGISRQKISSFVNEKAIPGLLDATKICNALGLNLNYLLSPDIVGAKPQAHPFLAALEYLESSKKLGVVQLFENRKKAIDYFCDYYLLEKIDWIKIVTSSGRGLLENERFKKALGRQFRDHNMDASAVKIIQTMPMFAYQRELFEPQDIGNECGRHVKESHRHFVDDFNIPKCNIRHFPGIVSTMSIISPNALLICHYISGRTGLEAFAMVVEKKKPGDEKYEEEGNRLYKYYLDRYFNACWKESISFEDIDTLEICDCKNGEIKDIVVELKNTNTKLHELLEKYIAKVRNHVHHK